MYDFSLTHGIGPGERNDRHDLAAFGRKLERATGLDPWLPHAWPMAAFPEARTSDGYNPGFGGALRGFQILAGLDPDGVARSGGPTERALDAALDPARPGRKIDAEEVYRGAPSATATVPTDRPADGGVKAAANIRKLSQRTGGPGTGNGSAKGTGGSSRPAIPTISPPRIRQSVGRGGVNALDDLLQARRNLARAGYAPRLRGIGEPAAMHGAAVRNGLLAYQQAKGLKADGLMRPGGETERALHRQIAVQQQRLKDRLAKDAAKAQRDLATVSGTVRNADAETLGARYTGAAFDRQRSEAYAEALDRMKQGHRKAGAETDAPAIAVTGSAEKAPGEIRIDENPDAATASAKADAPRRPTLFERSLAAEEKRAGALAAKRMHAGLGDVEHEAELAERRQRRAAAEKAYRTGRRPGLDAAGKAIRSIDIAIEHGALPRRFRPLVDHMSGAGHRPDPGRYLAVLDRLALLREKRPAVFDTLPPRLRTAVAVHRHLAARDGRLDPDDRSDDNLAALGRRSSIVRSIASELDRSEALRTLGFIADWTPVVGEFKSGVEALIALHNYAKARERGDSESAARYGEEAAWAFVGAAPGLGYSKKGRKLLRQLAAPVGKLSVKAADALARKIEDAAARRQPKRDIGDKPEGHLKNFEPGPRREFSERLAARGKLSILRLYAKISKREKLGLDDIFPEGMTGLNKKQRRIANIAIADAKGRAGEDRVNEWLRDGGFTTAAKGPGRTVNVKGKGRRRYDIATTDKFRSFLGLFVFPGTYKATIRNNRTVQIEVKSGGGKKKPRQKVIDKEVKEASEEGKPLKVAIRDNLVIVDVVDLQLPTHWIDKETFADKLRGPLTNKFGRLRTDAFLRDLDEFYRRSTDKTPIPFGVVLLYLAGRLPRLDDDERPDPPAPFRSLGSTPPGRPGWRG